MQYYFLSKGANVISKPKHFNTNITCIKLILITVNIKKIQTHT